MIGRSDGVTTCEAETPHPSSASASILILGSYFVCYFQHPPSSIVSN